MSKVDGLDIFVMSDQPEQCRQCGCRTEFEDLDSVAQDLRNPQLHECPSCSYKYVLVEDDEEE